jgi:hypothetical protein
MSVLGHLPLLNSAVPTRFGLALIAVVAILLAFSVHAAAAAGSAAWLRYGWALALAAVLLPIAPTPLLAARAAPVPAFFTTGQWRQYVHGDQSVLSADSRIWTGAFTAMDWDDATGQQYRVDGGYFLGPGKHGRGVFDAPARPTTALLTNVAYYGGNRSITSAQRAAFRADLRYWHTAIVVVGPYTPYRDQLRYALNQLTGRPARLVAGVLLWDVRALSG